MSSWMEALLAFDRMICITFPKRFKFFKLKKLLVPIILGMFGFILAIHFMDAAYTLKWTTSASASIANSSSNRAVIIALNYFEKDSLTKFFF